MPNLSASRKQQIIDLISEDADLPHELKHLLFPPERQEYELVFAGKENEEDVLAETMAVPLQPIRTFGGNENEWHNMLIFGDNLQVMKMLLKLKDEGQLVNADGLRGVKLVYIDPPFGTGDEYGPSSGEVSYTAKIQGTKFISFLRKRLIFIRELLADNGTVFVRLDHHFGHYIKVIMDEVFKEQNFRNEIVINRVKKRLRGLTRFNVSSESLFFYSKSSDFYFNNPEAARACNFCGREKEPIWDDLTSPGLRNPPERVIFGKTYLPRRGRHFSYVQSKIDQFSEGGRLRINEEENYFDLEGRRVEGRPEYLQTELVPVDNDWTDIKGYAFANDYPTENHEELLERVIRTGAAEGDIVMDAFAGSGTTIATAEKLGMRWIGIDSGKLSIYTIQRRLANLKTAIGNKRGRSLKPKPFTLYNAGLYDFSRLKSLVWEDWRFTALSLFQCQDKPHKVSGITLDGYRSGDDVLVFNHRMEGGTVLDYGFIDDLHSQIGSKIGTRFFIIAPAASVTFLEDYVSKGSTRYYILRIPYSIINELHNKDFEPLSQPMDETQVNETVDAIGFDFIRPPRVECEYTRLTNPANETEEVAIKIKTFKSESMAKGASLKGNLETLSMVLIDYDYPYDPSRKGKESPPPFEFDNRFYGSEIREANGEFRLPFAMLGEYLMLIYIDTYGNEYTEIKSIADFERVVS